MIIKKPLRCLQNHLFLAICVLKQFSASSFPRCVPDETHSQSHRHNRIVTRHVRSPAHSLDSLNRSWILSALFIFRSGQIVVGRMSTPLTQGERCSRRPLPSTCRSRIVLADALCPAPMEVPGLLFGEVRRGIITLVYQFGRQTRPHGPVCHPLGQL